MLSSHFTNQMSLKTNSVHFESKRNDATLSCIKGCREDYMIKLTNQNLQMQNKAADEFILCFPSCFFPQVGQENYVEPQSCKNDCMRASDSCYFYSSDVESFACILEDEKCKKDCSNII